MPKYVRMVDNVVQEIVECDDVSATYHPDCGFVPVSNFANEPSFLDIYVPESNSFVPQPEPIPDPPVTFTVTEIGSPTSPSTGA
jgi:hypothetical protein